MIKVENLKVYNIARAVYSARNPKNSWDRSDSDLDNDILGEKDLALAKKLFDAGSEHRKYLRQIFISLDITAPLYVWAEIDTYKIGTVRNSCSFMHKGVSKPFEITDFSIHDKNVYEVLSPLTTTKYELVYPYETDEYKIYTGANGRTYRVYKNGRVFAEPFEYTDTKGRHRIFEYSECTMSESPNNYFYCRLGGKNGEQWQLHRLVATLWLDNPNNYDTVNHIDGNKGNNSVENLEWCSREDNIKKGFNDGLYNNGKSLHTKYIKWKNGHTVVSPFVKSAIIYDHNKNGLTCKELSEKYDITVSQVNNIISYKYTENESLFNLCYMWETIINTLNDLRNDYLETKDDTIFQQIRCLLPCGYNQKSTLTLDYEVAYRMICQRKNHKLDEWREFTDILINKLPYMKELIGE